MRYDLLLHVDTDDASLKTALRNAENYAAAGVSEPYAIAFVLNARAVTLVRAGACAQQEAITRLHGQGVRFFVCQNALREQGLTPADLIPEAETVPAGIVHIVQLQHQGYAYVKP
jgi:intracellular sulfur oxidation DsrE/DsrF family protein